MERDKSACRDLEAKGWSVIIIWECQIQLKGYLSELAMGIHKKPVIGHKQPKIKKIQ
jgi:G:T-mismatch repair DNA endonuclease (very short patch repair protein)